MIYLIANKYPLTEFLFKGLEDVEPLLLPTTGKSLFSKVKNKILVRLSTFFNINFCPNFFPKNIQQKLKNIQQSDDLVYLGADLNTCFVISHLCKKFHSKSVFIWDPCSTIRDCESRFKKIRKYGFSISSFDYNDAQKYNLYFAGTFYRKVKNTGNPKNSQNDFFFCGKDKGRREHILKVMEILSNIGKCEFIIPNKTDAMEYHDYIEHVKNSKILCDFNQSGQSGLTMRVMESIFFQRKLITDNKDIERYDFFQSSNIFILKEPIKPNEIYEWMKVPFVPYKDDVLQNYCVKKTLRRIISSINIS